MAKHCQTGKGMFLKQPFHVLRHMTMDELVDLKKQRAYAVEAGKPLTCLDGCALLHPLIYAGLRISHLMGGFKVAVNGRAPRTRRPVIYAASHIGQPMDITQLVSGQLTHEVKSDIAEMLRGEMAAMKLAAWECARRADIPEGYADTFVNNRLNEWPCYTLGLLQRRLRKATGQVTYSEAFAHLDRLHPSRENGFLLRR